MLPNSVYLCLKLIFILINFYHFRYCDLLEDLEKRIPLTNTDIPISYKWFDCFCGNSKVFRSSMSKLYIIFTTIVV